MLDSCDTVVITHTFGEGNRVANLLANEGLILTKDANYIEESLCKNKVREQLFYDRINGTY